MAIKNQEGKINFLRVHEVGSGWGPATDQLDAEVIFRVTGGASDFAYGFQLRNDSNGPAHEAMFSLLKEAHEKNLTVHFDYDEKAGKKNHRAFRIWLTSNGTSGSVQPVGGVVIA